MKLKGLLIAGIILVVVGAVFISGFFIVKYAHDNTMDGPGMINTRAFSRFYYTYGGGMLGERYTLTVDEFKLDYYKCESNGYTETTKQIDLDSDTYSEIERLLDEGGVREWTNLPKTDEFALDAPTTYLSVTFADGLEIKVNEEDIPPEDGWAKIKEIVDFLDKMAN